MKSAIQLSCFVLFSFLFIQCAKDELLTDSDALYNDQMEKIGICTELIAEDHSRAFGLSHLFWNKSILRVRFLEGSPYIQNKVKQYAAEWSRYANVEFQFVDVEPSDVRITFDSDDGSWSYIGRTNSYISSNRPTMNFGWFNSRTSEKEFRRTTLHEFGHAIGLSHEHQHPHVAIDWNKEAVYNYYERTQDWSKSDVDNNVFKKYSTANSNYSVYDPASIMHYYIPRSLVLSNWVYAYNTVLSETDKEFIGKMYPGRLTEIMECNCPDHGDVIACDDFEGYDATGFANATTWKPWTPGGDKGELQAYTWGKVLKFEYDQSRNPDGLYTPDLDASTSFSLSWDMYIGPENSGYFNIQKTEESGGEFGAQFYFNSDQNGELIINNRRIDFEYDQNHWINIELHRNLEEGIYVFLIDQVDIVSWPLEWNYYNGQGSNDFQAINFYAVDADSRFWLDNFCVAVLDSAKALAQSDQHITNREALKTESNYQRHTRRPKISLD